VAELQVAGGELVLHLSAAEKAEAVHGDLRVPLSGSGGSKYSRTPALRRMQVSRSE